MELPKTIMQRIEQHRALASAYYLPEEAPFWLRYRWLIATLMWAAVMIISAVAAGGTSWSDGFSGNLTAGILGSVLFAFLGTHFDTENARRQDAIYKRVDAMSAWTYEKHLIDEFEQHLMLGESVDIRVLRPRSGPDSLLYWAGAIIDPATQKPVMFGRRRSSNVFLIRVSAPPLLANSTQFHEAYEKSAIIPGPYLCRFQERSWHLGKSMSSDEWFEFSYHGTGAEPVDSTTADEFLERVSNNWKT